MKFHPDGSVEMKGDNVRSGDKVQKSLYAIRDLQQPTLTFATYNYISLLADPDKPNANGRRGVSRKYDIQYAFSEDLVKNLNAQKDAKIQAFTLSGRLHDSKAWFSRVGAEGIIAEKTLGILRKMDSLRWRCNESVNFLTVANGQKLSDQYIYDLHLGGPGDPYENVFAITNLERKGAIFYYTFDCRGDMVLLKAPKIPKRLSMYDKGVEEDWATSRYFDFRLSDSTKLSFKKQAKDVPEDQAQSVVLEPRDIDQCNNSNGLGKLCADNNTQNLKKDTDAMFSLRYWCYGHTQRNLRDAWGIRQGGTRRLVWEFAKPKGFAYHFSFITFRHGEQPFIVSEMQHENLQSYKNYLFINNNFHFLFYWHKSRREYLPIHVGYDWYLKTPTNQKMYDQFYSRTVGKNSPWVGLAISRYKSSLQKDPQRSGSDNAKNYYALLPSILGFMFHRQRGSQAACQSCAANQSKEPTGVAVPLYLPRDLE